MQQDQSDEALAFSGRCQLHKCKLKANRELDLVVAGVLLLKYEKGGAERERGMHGCSYRAGLGNFRDEDKRLDLRKAGP